MLISTPWYLRRQCLCPHSEPQHSLFPQETLQDQQVGLTQASMKSLLSPLSSSVHETLCVPSKMEFLFFPLLWSSCVQAQLAFEAKCSGGSS